MKVRVKKYRKTAMWLKHGYSCPCSHCGWDSGFSMTPLEGKIHEFKFCPNCGKRMEKAEW